MDMPTELKLITEKAAAAHSLQELRSASRTMTKNYTERKGTASCLNEASLFGAVYSAVRMPATFAAVYSAFSHTIECFPMKEEYSLLDVGAGTGAGAIAVSMLSELSSATCLERENEMRSLGEEYTSVSPTLADKCIWKSGDILSGLDESADIVLSSYVLNEMTESSRLSAVRDMWEHTRQLLLIVEPGTPQGFSGLKAVREQLIGLGAHIAAPCIGNGVCPMAEDDWCHFTVRVQRSRLHRMIKEADVPYEDEKFSYIASVREPVIVQGRRILRHPRIGKGNIGLTMCTGECIENTVITKKDRELFKSARKADCGDII